MATNCFKRKGGTFEKWPFKCILSSLKSLDIPKWLTEYPVRPTEKKWVKCYSSSGRQWFWNQMNLKSIYRQIFHTSRSKGVKKKTNNLLELHVNKHVGLDRVVLHGLILVLCRVVLKIIKNLMKATTLHDQPSINTINHYHCR